MSGSRWIRLWLFVLVFGLLGSSQIAVGQDCIPDLTELNLRMSAEWADVLLNNNATRSAPYRYVLCPNTTFHMGSPEDQIVPVLDLTFVTCGDDGLLENNCTILDGILNDTVVIAEIVLLRTFSNYNRLLTVFSGIRFDTSYGTSVAAWDIYPMRVVFLHCYWTRNRGPRIIDNQVPIPQFPAIGEEAMIVQLDDSVIENEEFLLEADEEFESGETPLNVAVLTLGGQLQFDNVTFRSNHLNYFIFASIARCNIRNSLVANNQMEEGVFGQFSFITVSTTRFENNRYLVGSLSVADASLESRFNEFYGNTGLADVIVLSIDRRTRTPDSEVASSCFVDGTYLAGPVLIAGLGRHSYEDVFVAGVVGDCPSQPFLESENQLCFDEDGRYLADQPCLGRCDAETFFDAEICALDPQPSAAPTNTPQPTATAAPTPDCFEAEFATFAQTEFKMKRCKWIRRNKVSKKLREKRNKKYCQDPQSDAQKACPVTCGLCE